ncbi:VOC family protein [Streptomyces kronopolitis]|uniref:VOC family protein n=1 Tax=Streptomyces kronopolitis TaxID=1612435 RepID=UPI0020C01272|nr:VOC family protein [Streptomyces kronopolitis]MCL6298000.1 VOC family protein [Streptomyces kronopolitis]
MEITEPTPGAPCLVELGTSDVDAAKEYYRQVFGWRAETDPRPEAGGYTMLYLDDAPVAALAPLYMSGQPTAWTVSFATRDADALAAAVTEAGGQQLMGPMDVFDLGRFAVLCDPEGAMFSIWQARSFAGAGVLNAPGSLGWVELATRDAEGAKDFYTRIFGWTVGTHADYPQWGLDGADFGGLTALDEFYPDDVRAHWLPYFAVADVDATAARAAESGGMLLVPPTDVPAGPRVAVIRDPQGGSFGIHRVGTEG